MSSIQTFTTIHIRRCVRLGKSRLNRFGVYADAAGSICLVSCDSLECSDPVALFTAPNSLPLFPATVTYAGERDPPPGEGFDPFEREVHGPTVVLDDRAGHVRVNDSSSRTIDVWTCHFRRARLCPYIARSVAKRVFVRLCDISLHHNSVRRDIYMGA